MLAVAHSPLHLMMSTTPGACAGSYSVTRTWTATDACGNASQASQTINVQDITAPVIAALPGPSTIDCPAAPVFTQATAVDACGSAFTLTFNDVTTPGACAGSYSVTRTWTATDACGNASQASQTINVQDITAPVIAALPGPSTIDCPAAQYLLRQLLLMLAVAHSPLHLMMLQLRALALALTA